MTRSFYVVLGVPPTENPSGIRRAFRELALRYHPDRAGAQSTPYFQELVNAYQVLSDPLLRASYDEGLERAGERERSAPEPFAQTRRPRSRPLVLRRRLSLFHDFDAHRPAREEIWDRFVSSFTSPWEPKSQRVEPLRLELVIAPEQAAQGGLLALGVPVFHPCRWCHGAGSGGWVTCPQCRGRGFTEHEEEIEVAIPSRTADGTILRVPLSAMGVPRVLLQIAIRVGV